jgi:hypothetical protein
METSAMLMDGLVEANINVAMQLFLGQKRVLVCQCDAVYCCHVSLNSLHLQNSCSAAQVDACFARGTLVGSAFH